MVTIQDHTILLVIKTIFSVRAGSDLSVPQLEARYIDHAVCSMGGTLCGAGSIVSWINLVYEAWKGSSEGLTHELVRDDQAADTTA